MRFRGLDKATLEELQAIGKCDICGAPATTHVRAEFHEDLGDGPMKKKGVPARCGASAMFTRGSRW